MRNVELAKIVKKELDTKRYNVDFEKILNDIDMTFDDNAKQEDIQNIVDSYLAELEY